MFCPSGLIDDYFCQGFLDEFTLLASSIIPPGEIESIHGNGNRVERGHDLSILIDGNFYSNRVNNIPGNTYQQKYPTIEQQMKIAPKRASNGEELFYLKKILSTK